MAKSMTGYGRAGHIINGRDISVELRSVNHRYFEISVRVPRAFSFLEEKIKQRVQSCVSRGKLEAAVFINNIDVTDTDIELNMNLARSYAEAMERMSDELGIKNESSASVIARFPDVFITKRVVPDEEQLWADVQQALDGAIERFCEMRGLEGESLKQDITERLEGIGVRIGEIEGQSAERLERFRDKLTAKMQAVLENTEIDESRILLEAALYADKSAIDEETVRLRSHLSQFGMIFMSDEPVGRKLDFLVQEMNREINTIGSKANDLEITSAVVDIKAEIEKIREQIQNIE